MSGTGGERHLVAAVVVSLIVGFSASARADTLCADSVDDPVPMSLRNGSFDATRSACMRSDVDVRLGAHALIDTPDFYGTLGGDLLLGIRFVEHLGFEWGVNLRLVDVTFAQTAVLSATEADYGPISIHGAVSQARKLAGRDLQLGGMTRFELPFTRSSLETSAAGVQVAGLATWHAQSYVVLHSRVALLGWYASSAAGTESRGAVAASSDASFRMYSWLSLLAGVEVQAGWYGGFDHLAARAGAHWRVYGPWRLDAGLVAPLAGDERTNAAFTIGVRRDR